MIAFNIHERRKAYRVYYDFIVNCEIINPKDSSLRNKTALARDINSEGIYFEIDESLTLGTAINVSFQLPQINSSIQATVKVVKVEIAGGESKFGIGAIFTKLEDRDSGLIKQLMERLNINRLLELIIKKEGSDLHLLAERVPYIRKYGEIEPLDWPKLSAPDVKYLLYTIMTKQQIKNFERDKELDFAIQYDMLNRFRINVHQQKGFTEATLRLINTKISSFEDLSIPKVVEDLANIRDGLIIIAGPTGSGKTTTIAAIVDFINHKRKAVIITLERPIEYVYSDEKSIIKQREVGIDTYSFSSALKSTLRQDPNVIVVGELDDIETIRTAIIAAEAGHLVIASFHAPNTIQAIDRLVSIFPFDARKHILSQLSHCLRGIITQILIPRCDRKGRVLATEVLVATDSVKRIIRNDELIQIPTSIQTAGAYRMQRMSESIKKLVDQQVIDPQTADFYSEEFTKYVR